jgi:hypothetical protein
MGSIWPLQSAQPFGGKLKETALISDKYGDDMVRMTSVERRKIHWS